MRELMKWTLKMKNASSNYNLNNALLTGLYKNIM